MNNTEKTKYKFQITFKLIKKFREVWLTSNDYEKSFIETTLGAAIFYLPITKKTFSGLISEEASKISKKKWVKEHQYPRKLSAKFILTNPPKNVDEFKKMYYEKYGIWNWVTKVENTNLREYQKENNFTTPEKSYKKCGIKLIKL